MNEERFITQTKFYDPEQGPEVCSGNCTEAALATVLGLRLEDVPSFQGMRGPEYWEALDAFLESRGFQALRYDGEHVYDGVYLADGPSARGCGHFVVMRNGALWHDPHPSRAGLEKIEATTILVPLDPATAVLRASADVLAEGDLCKHDPHCYLFGKGIPCPHHVEPDVTRAADTPTFDPPPEGFTCFHCGDHFANTPKGLRAAREHFGETPRADPRCHEAQLDATQWCVPPLDEQSRWILGRPCFMLIGMANALRKLGYEISPKAEEEQAVCIHWMLGLYAKHGAKWRVEAARVLKSVADEQL